MKYYIVDPWNGEILHTLATIKTARYTVRLYAKDWYSVDLFAEWNGSLTLL